MLAVALLAYLLGSVPAGVVYSRLRGEDIRGRDLPGGSGSWRQYGPAVGVGVALADALKGTLAVALAQALAPHAPLAAALATAGAVLGHCYPVWFGFRGGGGIATLIGALALAAPQALLAAAATAAVLMPLYKFGLQRWVGLNVIPVVTLLAVPALLWVAWQQGGFWAAALGATAMGVRALHMLVQMRRGPQTPQQEPPLP